MATEPATEAVAGVRLHDLRHTAAVAWLTAGVGVVQVSRWLGHAQPTVTMNVYGDWVPAEAENPLPEPKSVSNVVAPAEPDWLVERRRAQSHSSATGLPRRLRSRAARTGLTS